MGEELEERGSCSKGMEGENRKDQYERLDG